MKLRLISVLLAFFVFASLSACANHEGGSIQTPTPAITAEPESVEASQTPEIQREQTRAEKLLADGQAGNGRAYTDLGRMYEQGNGVDQDYDKALEFYRLSAEAEKPDFKGMRYAGLMYQDGIGVEQDYVEAASCFQVAAEAGDVSAAYFLGLLYEEGNGVDQSLEEAKKWYEEAVSTLDDFLESSKNSGPEELKLALCRLAEIAMTDGDTDTAIQYYQYAADLGWSAAEEKLKELGVVA